MTVNLIDISVGCFVEDPVVIVVEAVDLCRGSELRWNGSLNTSVISLERICVYDGILEGCLVTNSTAGLGVISGTWRSAQAVCYLVGR